MEEDPRIATLDALRRGLENVLSILEGGDPGDAALARAWRACDEAFEGFRAESEARRGTALPAEVESRLAGVRRLHAVASSMTARSRDAVGAELETLAAIRRRLRPLAHRRAEAPGEARSCDING